MRFKIILLFFLIISFSSNGQELSNPAYANAVVAVESIIIDNDIYVLYEVEHGYFRINNVEYKETNPALKTSAALVRFDKNNNLKKVALLSSDEDGKSFYSSLKYENNKLFATGNRRESLYYDGVKVITDENELWFSHGFALEIEKDLSFKHVYEFSNSSDVIDIDYYEGEYFISGNFVDTTVTYQKNYKIKNNYRTTKYDGYEEVFILAIDAVTKEAKRHVSFGGPNHSPVIEIQISERGKMMVLGYSGEVYFRFKDKIFFTNSHELFKSMYIMCIDIDFNFNFFSKIDNQPFFDDFVLDEFGDVYLSFGCWGVFTFNDEFLIENIKEQNIICKINGSTGDLIWHNLSRTVKNEFNSFTNLEHIIIDGGKVYWIGQYPDSTIIENELLLPLKYNKKANVIIVELNKEDGKFIKYERVAAGMPLRIDMVLQKQDNKLCFFAYYVPTSYAINEVDKIFPSGQLKHNRIIFDFKKSTVSSIPGYDNDGEIFRIYPSLINVGELINLEIIDNSFGEKYEYEFHNLNGQAIKKGYIIGNSNISSNGLIPDTYILRLSNSTIIKHFKIIII